MRIGLKCLFFLLLCTVTAYGAGSLSVVNLSGHARACVELLPSAPEMHQMLDVLEKEGVYAQRGGDELRVKFVTLQGVIEHVLVCGYAIGEIKRLEGVIHTPAPATPLCASVREVDLELLDRSLHGDVKKLLTVQSRAHLMRQYLHHGARLTITYPQVGLAIRTSEQRAVYNEIRARYPESLIDHPLDAKAIDDQMIGATYTFQNAQGKWFAFSIMSKQAIDPREDSEWAIWLGPIDHPAVRKRVVQVSRYFNSIGGPSINHG